LFAAAGARGCARCAVRARAVRSCFVFWGQQAAQRSSSRGATGTHRNQSYKPHWLASVCSGRPWIGRPLSRDRNMNAPPQPSLPRAMLHIGPHKTGTSHVQDGLARLFSGCDGPWCWPSMKSGRARFPGKWFASLAAGLRSEARDEKVPYWGPRGIAPFGTSGEAVDYYRKKLHATAAGNQSLVISSELFAMLALMPGSVARLGACLSAYDQRVDVVVVFRSRVAHLRSWYSQIAGQSVLSTPQFGDDPMILWPRRHEAHQNATPPAPRQLLPSEWLFELLGEADEALEGSILSIHRMSDGFASIFGRQAINIIAYQRIETQPRDLLHVILCDVMGIAQCKNGTMPLPRISPSNEQRKGSEADELVGQAKRLIVDDVAFSHCRPAVLTRVLSHDVALEAAISNMRKAGTLPLRCSTLASISRLFEGYDQRFVDAYADRFIGGLPRAEHATAWCELDPVPFLRLLRSPNSTLVRLAGQRVCEGRAL